MDSASQIRSCYDSGDLPKSSHWRGKGKLVGFRGGAGSGRFNCELGVAYCSALRAEGIRLGFKGLLYVPT